MQLFSPPLAVSLQKPDQPLPLHSPAFLRNKPARTASFKVSMSLDPKFVLFYLEI